MIGSRVEIDTSDLEAGMRQLASRLQVVTPTVATGTAQRVAGELRTALPKRTGRLAASVQVARSPVGAAVSYGTGVPYANYIGNRTGAPDNAVAGSAVAFAAAMYAAGKRETSRL
jgi:hypothetical protein